MKALQREAYRETTQRTTARRDRHGQQANSLPRVAAPHHPSGNASFAGRKNSTETTTGRVPRNCMRVVTTPMQSRKDAEFAVESGFGSVRGPQKGSLRAHTPTLSPHDETIARANTAATEN